MRSFSAILGACLYAASSVNAKPANPLNAFTNKTVSWDANTLLSVPNTAAFNNATSRWNNNDVPNFALAITPSTEDDVAQAIKIARSVNVPFLGTGGRHSVNAQLSQVQNGVSIDMSGFKDVVIDAAAGTLTVGGGVRFSEIYDAVFEAGYVMPVGSCACPGMVGATLGGGVGRYQGLDGLIIDSLQSVRLVNADGDIIDVSDDVNSDLMWGIRGAGPNFGIITSATYKMAPQTNNGMVVNADFILPAASNATYFDLLASLEQDMPAELATITIIDYNATSAEAQIIVNWVYIGTEEDADKYISPLKAMNPITQSISTVPYNNLIKTAAGGLGVAICEQTKLNSWGANYQHLDAGVFGSVFQEMSDFYSKYPDGQGSTIEMEIFSNQAVMAVANDATAYPWRESKGYVIISFAFGSDETESAGETLGKHIRDEYAAVGGWDDLAVYSSYAHGDETLTQMFGSNLPRLQTLKAKYDPDNVFRFYHSVAA